VLNDEGVLGDEGRRWKPL